MPELPEVETVRRSLDPALAGERITQATIFDARLVRPHQPVDVAAALQGEVFAHVARRGKHLLLALESDRTLVVHLRMTGSFRVGPQAELPVDRHERARLRLDSGIHVVYRDVRRFGTWSLLDDVELRTTLFARLGPEPLGRFGARDLGRILEGRRAPLKSVLLDQRRLAGLGNIYVDEALWYARLHPLRPAGDLDPDEVRRLHRAVRLVLRRGIERQGATLRDYVRPDGSQGGMQAEFRAYGRSGEPCDRCGNVLASLRVGGRGTTWCPACTSAGSSAT